MTTMRIGVPTAERAATARPRRVANLDRDLRTPARRDRTRSPAAGADRPRAAHGRGSRGAQALDDEQAAKDLAEAELLLGLRPDRPRLARVVRLAAGVRGASRHGRRLRHLPLQPDRIALERAGGAARVGAVRRLRRTDPLRRVCTVRLPPIPLHLLPAARKPAAAHQGHRGTVATHETALARGGEVGRGARRRWKPTSARSR